LNTSAEKPADPIPQDVIADRYTVQSLLGRGGMATVYLCIDSTDGKRVAVKVLRREIGSAVIVERFLREVRLSSNFDHPRIPKVLDSGVLGDLPYYVMTYIEGESLRARLDREKQLPVDDAIRIAAAVAGTMSHAHARGIIHRDIKPANILLASDGVYVLDFGVARAIVESADDRLTSTGVAVGTPAYMSPEQALADTGIDARSDIYSLGCVAYEMIAGIPPFVGATSQAVMARRFVATAPPLSETRDGVPEHVQMAIAKSLMRAPADRWQTATQFADALTAEGSGSRASRFTTIMQKLRRRKRLVASVIALPLITGMVVAIASLSGSITGMFRQRVALDPRRVAVLYFEDISADHSLGYLASGLTDGLIEELNSVPAIQVVSRNGVKPFRDQAVRLDSIAGVLRTGTLLEGTIQRSGDSLRVTAHIVEGSTSTRLQSARIERKMGELFLLEDDLAQQVAGLLRRRIGLEIRLKEAEAATRSDRARTLVFRANEARDEAAGMMGGDSVEGARGLSLLRRADSLFNEAEQADRKWVGPIIGRGWVALEAALQQAGEPSDEAFRKAIGQADKALLSDRNNARALELRGTARYSSAIRAPGNDNEFKLMLEEAETDLNRAVALAPTLASAWGSLSRVHVARGELPTAEREARRALAMDAYLEDAPRIVFALFRAYLLGDSIPNAWRWCERGARDFPVNAQFVDCRLSLLALDVRKKANPTLAWDLVAEGDRREPQERATAIGRPYLPTFRKMMAAVVSARAGQKDRARAVAARARAFVANDHVLSTDLKFDDAYLQLVLGDQTAAVQLLSDYLRERPSRAELVSKHPRWKSLRSNAKFRELIRRTTAAR
jgi:serine/threonine protein kinase/tetratricopeptide (TPR) repeat protein